MTGLDGRRVYLDWNATAPLRPEARAAMVEAMDAVGNPSSVHAEGRAARALVERARARVARLVGCDPSEIVFTSGATEAAALAVAQKDRHGGVFLALPTEHDCLHVWSERALPSVIGRSGRSDPDGAGALLTKITGLRTDRAEAPGAREGGLLAVSAASGETGIRFGSAEGEPSGCHTLFGTVRVATVNDVTQLAGRVPLDFAGAERPATYALLSAHKLGGPAGVGCLLNFSQGSLIPHARGGGQEMGRRSGTENVVGIAGFGAAAEAALRDLEAGVWTRVENLRNILEERLASVAPETIFFGQETARLPNTSCFAVPGWKGETQVMQMDLAGFAVSAGAACSSGKVRESRVLRAMGHDAETASSAIRVSLGPTTTEAEAMAFAEAWAAAHGKRRARAA